MSIAPGVSLELLPAHAQVNDARLERHGRVSHASALFRPTLQRSVHRLETLTRSVEEATAHKADQQAGEALGVVQAATGGR